MESIVVIYHSPSLRGAQRRSNPRRATPISTSIAKHPLCFAALRALGGDNRRLPGLLRRCAPRNDERVSSYVIYGLQIIIIFVNLA